MSDHEAYAARILTFAPDGRVVDASRGTFEPQSMRVATGGADARPYADLADVPVSRVYLGVQPGAATDGTSTSLATTGTADRSFIVIERENGYKQVIETNADAAQQTLDVSKGAIAPADVAQDAPARMDIFVPSTAPAPADPNVATNADRGTPRGVAAETNIGAYLSPDAVRVDLTAPAYANLTSDRHLTRYANELISNAQSGSANLAADARGKTDSLSPSAVDATRSSDSWSSSLVRETAGSVGAADLERVAAHVEARKAELAAKDLSPSTTASAAHAPGTQTSFDLGVSHGTGGPSPAQNAAAEASPQTQPQTQTSGGAGGPTDPNLTQTPDGDPKNEPKPELTPVERAQTGIGVENRGREVVGDRAAFDRAADARLDTLQVKYNQFDVQETLESSRASNAHQSAEQQLQYVRDGQPAVARPGYQQDGRIVGMTAESVTQDIGQYKVAVYSTKGLMEMASDPAALQSTLSRAAEQGTSVGLNFSRSGGLSVAELGQSQNLGQQQDRGMGRSLF